MNKSVRKIIKDRSNGRCYYCGEQLDRLFHMDHFFPKNKKHWLKNEKLMMKTFENGNCPINLTDIDDLRNMVPSCPRCNFWKSTLLVSAFRGSISNIVGKLLKYNNKFNMAVSYNMVHISHDSLVFYFETDEMKYKHYEIFNS